MPPQSRLDALVAELLLKGSPQMLHCVVASHPVQQKHVLSSLAHLAKKSFVELKEPVLGGGSGAAGSHCSPAAADWNSLSMRKCWIVCTFGTAGDEALMRQAAVQVLCARTNNFCPQFRVVLLLRSAAEYDALPPISRVLSGMKQGRGRLLDLGDTADADPQLSSDPETGILADSGMHVIEPSLEEWLDYTNVEDAVGGVAELQESVFNSDPDVQVVKYSAAYGRGTPFIRILRDALKFNIVVHTLDLTRSECGDVVGMCLGSILYTSRKLRTIVLDSCSLTDAGVVHVAQAVRSNEFVKVLKLSRNPSMTDASLLAIASMFTQGSKATLEELDLSYNNVVYDVRFEWTPAALNHLWDALGHYKQLKKVNLASCGLLSDHVLEASSRWLSIGNELTELSLAHNYLGDEVIAATLAHMHHVRFLDLEHVQLGAAGFRAVGFAMSEWKLPIEVLRLDANNASLERTFDAARLEALGCPLSQTMLSIVCDETTAAALYVVESLTGNTTLHTISLSRSMIGDEAVMSMCDMLINGLCAVQHLDIAGNTNVEEASAHKIKELLVGGYFNNSSDDNAAATDGQHPSEPEKPKRGTADHPLIASLVLASNSTAIGERALLALYFNKGLRTLDISNMALVDAMLLPLNEGMKTNPHLRIERLLVGRNALWYDGVANIAAHMQLSTTLKELSLENTWAAFDDEAGRPTSLSKSRDEGLYYLSPLLRVLEGTAIGSPASSPSRGGTGGGGAVVVAATSAVTPSSSSDAALGCCCPLEILDLSGNDISERCARGIVQAIQSNRTLRVVWLRDNPLVTSALIAELGDPRVMLAYPV